MRCFNRLARIPSYELVKRVDLPGIARLSSESGQIASLLFDKSLRAFAVCSSNHYFLRFVFSLVWSNCLWI